MSVITTLKKRYETGGVNAVKTSIVDFVRYRLLRYFPGPVGKLVVLVGDRVRYRGITLNLGNPVIEDDLKARFLLKTYEEDEYELIRKHLPRDRPVVDLGGGIGFTSCYINTIVEDVPHLVIEANPHLISTIKENRDINRASFEVRNCAYSSDQEEVDFFIHHKFVGGSVQRSTEDNVTIEGRSLAALADEIGDSPVSLVCDIEGGEFDLIDGELSVLHENCHMLFVEFHNFTNHDVAKHRKRLLAGPFERIDAREDVEVYENSRFADE